MKQHKTRRNNIFNSEVMKFHVNKEISQEEIIYLYRYSSWALTSFVYFTIMPYNVMIYKLGVILSLLLLSKILNNLYIRFKDNKTVLRKLVLIETVGIELILLPTGGLESPFIWYALNPILVAASCLPPCFSWINLIFYLFTGSIMSFAIFNSEKLSFLQIFINNSNLMLVFILINLAMQLLSNLAKELQKSNIEKEKSMEQIMSLYQIIEALNNHSREEKLLETLTIYINKLTKCETSIFWLKNEDLIKTSKKFNEYEIELLTKDFENLSLDILKNCETQKIKLLEKEFFAFPISTYSSYYGITAIQINESLSNSEINQNVKLLKFISELTAVMLERFDIENIEEQLLVMEEQNRIANEMHDSVSQRLFSISYGIHGVLGCLDEISKGELKDYLIEMRDSSNVAMQELRKAIYKLSSKKNGKKYFQSTLKTYFNSISKLHDVNIDCKIDGDECILTYELKKALTRILRESCGNAIRHGKSKNIKIHLEIQNKCINLCVADDGIGFILSNIENKSGLGISNMKALVNSFNGRIEITSKEGEGTIIQILIPVQNNLYSQEGSVAI